MAAGVALLLLSLAAPGVSRGEPSPPDFVALRLASVPLPGSADERLVDEAPALEVFLSPSDFPDALLRLTLTGDAAAFAVNLDASAARGEALPSRVRWPRLGGRQLSVEDASRGLALSPPASGRPVTADELEAEDAALEWYLRPAAEGEGERLVATVRAVRLASAEGRTLLAWSAPPEASGCGPAEPGGPRCRFLGAARVVRSLSVHPSGRWLAVAGGDLRPRVDLLDAEPVRALRRIAFPPWHGTPLGAEFTPDGRHLVVADGEGVVHLWDAGSGGRHRRLAEGARSFALLDAGRLVAVSGEGGGLTLWRLRDGTIATRMGRRGHGASPLLAASGDGLRVAAVEYDEGGEATIVVWDVESAREADRIASAGRGFVDLSLDAEGEHLLATHDRRGLLRHRVGSDGGLEPWGGEPGRRCRGRLAWSPDRTLLACAARRGVTVLGAADGRLVHDLGVGLAGEPPSALAFAPDGASLFVTSGGSILTYRLGPAAEERGETR